MGSPSRNPPFTSLFLSLRAAAAASAAPSLHFLLLQQGWLYTVPRRGAVERWCMPREHYGGSPPHR